jgi:FOG: WD40 repeat
MLRDVSRHIFVSYSHRDADYVERLTWYLVELGFQVWTDQGLPPGAQWVRTIEEQIRACAVLVPVMSPHSAVSDWVTNEILLAQQLGKPIMPVLLAGHPFTALLSVQYEDVRGGRLPSAYFIEELARLSGTVLWAAPASPTMPAPTEPAPVVPEPALPAPTVPAPTGPAPAPGPQQPSAGPDTSDEPLPPSPVVPRRLVGIAGLLAAVLLMVSCVYGTIQVVEAFKPDSSPSTGASTTPPAGESGDRGILLWHRSVSVVAWSPDGGRLATAGEHDTRIWDVATAETVHTIPLGTSYVAWSPAGDRLALAGSPAQVWDANTGQRVYRLGDRPQDGAHRVLWEPGGTRLATVGTNIRIWNADTGSPLLTLAEGSEVVTAAAWSPRGGLLATAGYDNTVRIWDVSTGASTVLRGHTGRINDLAWSPTDAGRLATASDDNTVRIWDIATQQSVFTGDNQGQATAVVWSPDGRRLATASRDNTLRVWDVAADGFPMQALTEHSGRITALAWSGTGLATASDDNTVRIWETSTPQALTGHTRDVVDVEWSPDGTALATASSDGSVRIWSLA